MTEPKVSEAHQIMIYTLMIDDNYEAQATVVGKEVMLPIHINSNLYSEQPVRDDFGRVVKDENRKLMMTPAKYTREQCQKAVEKQLRRQGVIK